MLLIFESDLDNSGVPSTVFVMKTSSMNILQNVSFYVP